MFLIWWIATLQGSWEQISRGLQAIRTEPIIFFHGIHIFPVLQPVPSNISRGK